MTRKVNNWKTKVDETWWADATGPISFEDIDCSNNSRVKGGLYTSEEGLANHLNTVTIGIANRMRTGEPPLKKPCVIMDNPDKTESAKPFILVIRHTRTRGLVNIIMITTSRQCPIRMSVFVHKSTKNLKI